MRDLPIAYGNSCYAKTWSNKTIRFDALCDRLSATIRTSETAEEYPKLAKADRDRAKDKGGFVGGQLRDNRRKRENVACRSMLTEDVDHAAADFIPRFSDECPYAACLYTTHGHTPEAPRARLVVPLTRDVTPEEYTAIARYFAEEWGIDQFDECSYRPHQLMYWPTTPSNGEYIFRRIDGEWLDPDAYLAAHPNWKDCSLLPTSSRESTVRSQTAAKQENPLEKEGVVGAFCRAYPIEETIDQFLPDIYEPSEAEGRYDYIPADSSAGVVIYDGKFAYSHHATDPACGMLLNAFDLVRIHKFGDLEDKKSFTAMCEFAMRQDAVKLLVMAERSQQAQEDFKAENWKTRLRFMPRSKVLENSVMNEILILTNDPDCANFAFNEMANRVQVTGEVPWTRPRDNPFWRDADTAQLKALIDARYVTFSSRNHDVAFTKVTEDRRFHPIRDYLDALPPWDGIVRLERLYIDYLGAEDSSYVRAATRKPFVAAVARIYHPGTKFDNVPILDGPQGIGKSTLYYNLGGDYFSDSLSLTDMKDKAGAEKLQGFWILELGELAGMKKADVETVKSFISRTDDDYRLSYGKVVESHPRQCIIVGSTNSETGFLRDITGTRRFWPIHVTGNSIKKSWDMTRQDIDQLWAEAKYLYEHGEKLFLESGDTQGAEFAQRDAMEADERQGMVEEYLNTLLPEDWDTMDLFARRNFLHGSEFGGSAHTGTVRRTSVTNMEIWCECFGRSQSDLKPTDSYALSTLMTKVKGWEKAGRKKRFPIYGEQRFYRRV